MNGYYMFMGRGDWGMSRDRTFDPTFGGNVSTRLLGDWGLHRTGTSISAAPEWSSAWDLAAWKRRILFLREELGADTLILLMNGYELPYASKAFPEAVEREHANVRRDFFQDALDFARECGLTLGACFTTTGHARAYALAHPDLAVEGATGQCALDNLCHNKPGGRRYAETVADEVLGRYEGFEWISFHPPENSQVCRCSHCAQAFAAATGEEYDGADVAACTAFHWRSCLQFQHELEQRAAAMAPGARFFSFTIPGEFEKNFGAVAQSIPRSTMMMHWDYWSFGEGLPDLLASLEQFRSQGHRVAFMPSTGWSLDKLGENYGAAVREQVQAAKRSGVTDIVGFVGAIWHEPSLRATAWINKEASLI